eukprot:jgi/Orpsp1_1/1177902/evm.model.c7180000063264.1
MKSYRNSVQSNKNAIYNSKFLNVFDSEATITSISSIQSTLTVDSSFSTATTESRKRVSFSDEIFYIPPPVIVKEDKKKKKLEKEKLKEKAKKEKENKIKDKNESDEENINQNIKESNKGEKKKKKSSSVKRLFK